MFCIVQPRVSNTSNSPKVFQPFLEPDNRARFGIIEFALLYILVVDTQSVCNHIIISLAVSIFDICRRNGSKVQLYRNLGVSTS